MFASAGPVAVCVNGLGTHMIFKPATCDDMHLFEKHVGAANGAPGVPFQPSSDNLVTMSLSEPHQGRTDNNGRFLWTGM